MSLWMQLDQLQSRGSLAKKADSLAALHKKREETLSQFFTPAWLVRFIWQSIQPAFHENKCYSLFDNSVGAASMFRYASPSQFSLFGCDIDAELVHQATAILDNAGYDLSLVASDMTQVELGHYSVALINPPFSIPLHSPTLNPYEGVTHYGRHGPNSSAISHEYALAQALAHCDIVAAVVPETTTSKIDSWSIATNRLRGCFKLPRDTFKSENVAAVGCDLLIFGRELRGQQLQLNIPPHLKVRRESVNDTSEPVKLFAMHCRALTDIHSSPIHTVGTETTEPAIRIPPSEDKRVLLTRAGRSIKLTFFCGATEAKVKNRLLQERLHSSHSHRYPKETKFKGQYKLSLDVLILQPSPMDALSSLLQDISNAGGIPMVSRDLRYGIKALTKKHQKMMIPFGRTVYRKGAPSFTATARSMALLNRHQRGAVVEEGAIITATRTDEGFRVSTQRGVFDVDHDRFFEIFQPEDKVLERDYWEEIHAPIKNSYPEAINAISIKAKKAGLHDWLTWDFQREDLHELAFRPEGAICGWQMALGKSRLALALATLIKGHSLIVVKSRLIDEMVREMKALGLSATEYHVLQTVKDCDQLRKINLISYERLKRPLSSRYPKITLAKRLKGKITTLIADEGGLLANQHSQQTQSVRQINAKRRYIFDGTPCPNYPREMLALADWAIGDACSYQPYSLSRGFIEPRLFETATKQPTGRQAFIDDFISFEWATNEFLDSGQGAKREVPKIKTHNLGQFRSWISPMIKRRVQQEPAVQKYVRFPIPTLHPPINIEWEFHHLCLYIRTAEEFATWYRNYCDQQQHSQKGLNLTLILARLEACFKAANVPSKVSGYAVPFDELTSKERACIDLTISEVNKGRRPIVFARNPHVLNRLSEALNAESISNLVFTGEQTITQRTKALNEGIREGDVQVLLASLGVTQDGLNLHQLNTFIFYNRSYKAREEFQGIYRLIRPQQKSDVYGYFLHLEGSIDDYMGQLIQWKALASEAGLDFGEQPEDKEFVHFDAFIHRFIDSIPGLKEKIKHLKQVAA